MLRIGLTGGIASGKSAAAAEFARLGIPVVDADNVAREVTAHGAPALDELAALLPDEPLVVEGVLDRRRLRDLMFRDSALRGRVEAILHPRILARLKERLDTISGYYAIVVIPLLAETGADEWVDRVLVVDAPDADRIDRLMRRDGESEAGARRILTAQASRDERLAVADDVIDNSGSPADLHRAVAKLHEKYQAIATGQA